MGAGTRVLLAAIGLLIVVPDAHAGYELVAFGGLTRMEEGDAACREESQGTSTGLGLAASGITFAFGARFTMLNARGSDCQTRMQGTLIGIYGNGPIWKGEKDVVSIGGELIVNTTGRITHTAIPRADVVGDGGFAAELIYMRALSAEGSIKEGSETFPRFIFLVQARAGYRLASVTAQDAAFNDVDYSWNGPYAVVGMQIYMNPSR